MMDHHLLSVLLVVLHLVVIRCQNDVRRPPNILDPNSPRTLYLSHSSKVEITCKAEGRPQPTYKWTKNGEAIIVNDYVQYDSTSGNLTILSFLNRDDGTYMCIASNVFDNEGGRVTASSFAPPIKLFQTRVERFSDAPPTTKQVPEYSYVVLECANKGEVVGSDISTDWYESENSKDVSKDGGRLFIDLTGNLHFSYVLSKDATINFKYLCGISSRSDRLIRLGNENYLTVTPAADNVAIKPQLRYKNSGVKGLRYSKARLECMFSGYDPSPPRVPQIKWLDDTSNEITDGSGKYVLSEDGRALTINNLLEEDEKNYFCLASNSAGDSGPQQVFLDVTSAPIFNTNGAPRDQTVPENVDVHFNCDARSASGERPPDSPIWYINGVKMGQHTDPNKFQLSNANKTLTVKKVKKATDILCVQCEVINHVDRTWADACLNVILPIKIEKRPPEVQNINHGDSIDLTVKANTDPSMVLNYRWEFNNESYVGNNLPPFVFYDNVTSLAYINTSLLSNKEYDTVGGTYRRVIYHTFQTEFVDTIVVLKQTFSTWIIGLIIGITLLLIIIIIIIIFVICRKQRQGRF